MAMFVDSPIGDGIHFASSEHATAAIRPVLTVRYSP
jgi:hypothetical protein